LRWENSRKRVVYTWGKPSTASKTISRSAKYW
jgi:hypothetical protein